MEKKKLSARVDVIVGCQDDPDQLSSGDLLADDAAQSL